MRAAAFLLVLCVSGSLWGWGETGHHLIGRVASRLVGSHPALSESRARSKVEALSHVFYDSRIQEGHVSNVPDTYWRSYGEKGQEELDTDVNLLGDPTHYFEAETVLDIHSPSEFFKTKIPLNYQAAKEFFTGQKPNLKFFQVGTVAWRAQQFADLYMDVLSHYSMDCTKPFSPSWANPTRRAITAAGLLSHKIGDMAQPYHATVDYDGVMTGRKGLHAFFESTLVEALEIELEPLVLARAKEHLTSTSSRGFAPSVSDLTKIALRVYPEAGKEGGLHLSSGGVTAISIALLADSLSTMEEVRNRDLTYAVATFRDAQRMPQCFKNPIFVETKAVYEQATDPAKKKALLKVKIKSRPSDDEKKMASACRRSPQTWVDQKGEAVRRRSGADVDTVANWHRSILVDRLALGAAVLADIWVRGWLQGGQPHLCETYKYGLRPDFVSPTDPKCFGYALEEDPKDFLKQVSDGMGGVTHVTVLPWKKSAASTDACLAL